MLSNLATPNQFWELLGACGELLGNMARLMRSM